MEAESRKRGREEATESWDDRSKKQEVNESDVSEGNDGCGNRECMGLGVFDFPWLKEGEGVNMWWEEWNREEDTFLASLEENDGLEGCEQWSCNSPGRVPFLAGEQDATLPGLGEGEGEGEGLELENLEGWDGIWTSLLNQPLQWGI